MTLLSEFWSRARVSVGFSLKLKQLRYTLLVWGGEELSDACQWELAYESRAWIEAESHWNEYDQMDVWG